MAEANILPTEPPPPPPPPGARAEPYKFELSFSWHPGPAAQAALMLELCKMHGFPDGVPFNVAAPDDLLIAERRVAMPLPLRLEAELDQDGKIRVLGPAK